MINDRFKDEREPKTPVMVQGFGEWRTPVIDFSYYNLSSVRNQVLAPQTVQILTDYLIVMSLAQQMTPPGAVILCRKPMLVYWHSGRESLPPAPDADQRQQWRHFQERNVDYIVFSFFEKDLAPMFKDPAAKAQQRFEAVAVIERTGTMLIKVNHGSSK
jgi:hypothetical protein